MVYYYCNGWSISVIAVIMVSLLFLESVYMYMYSGTCIIYTCHVSEN